MLAKQIPILGDRFKSVNISKDLDDIFLATHSSKYYIGCTIVAIEILSSHTCKVGESEMPGYKRYATYIGPVQPFGQMHCTYCSVKFCTTWHTSLSAQAQSVTLILSTIDEALPHLSLAITPN